MAQDKVQFLKQLARQLVSDSEQMGTFETLSLLGGLEKVARESMKPTIDEIEALKAAETAARQAAMEAKAKAIAASRVKFDTSREEYKPALSNPDLVQALLKFRSDAERAQTSAPLTSIADAVSTSPIASVAPTANAQPNSVEEPEFQSIQLPEVAAVPKLNPLSSPRARGGSTKILRPENPNF